MHRQLGLLSIVRDGLNLGAEITVITCFPNFPEGIVFEGYKNKILERSQINNIKVIRVWSYITKNKGFFKRILDYVSFSFTSFFCRTI